ncbi:MAG: 16S rRNA (cytosine(967)-C(5))-methyltransferase RsmB [Candidatus Sumerlaeaceae bacterium]
MAAHPSPARITAVRVLLRLQQDKRVFSAECLDAEIRRARLSEPDARLATAIVYGVLRNTLLLDAQYREFLRMAPSRLDPGVRVLLRMATFQKFFLQRIPDHAIASDAVDIARRALRLHERDSRFVNAVIRRILALPEMQLPKGADPAGLSIRYSHPEWLVRYVERKFGGTTEAILASNNQEAPVAVRVNPLRTTRDDLIAVMRDLGGECRAGTLSPDALIVDEVPLQSLVKSVPFGSGAFYLQDEGSQAVAHLVAPKAGEKVLDVCAAPGGKTTHMAELSGGAATIVATDISEGRLNLLRENVARLQTPGVEVLPFVAVMDSDRFHGSFDAVLVDAPCSGLGTLRRNPEIRYRIQPEELKVLGQQQAELLARAALLVKPGGRLVYSTCTISDEENRDVVHGFLSTHPNFQHEMNTSGLPAAILQLRDKDNIFRTWPRHLDVDGFEAAILTRGYIRE